MDSLTLARYIIDDAIRSKYPISNLQLQSILYILDNKYKATTGQFLLEDEFTAYPRYPAITSIYEMYKGYGASKIYDFNDIKLPPDVDKDLVCQTIRPLFKQSVQQLVEDAKHINTEWEQTIEKYGAYFNILKRNQTEGNKSMELKKQNAAQDANYPVVGEIDFWDDSTETIYRVDDTHFQMEKSACAMEEFAILLNSPWFPENSYFVITQKSEQEYICTKTVIGYDGIESTLYGYASTPQAALQNCMDLFDFVQKTYNPENKRI